MILDYLIPIIAVIPVNSYLNIKRETKKNIQFSIYNI